MGQLPPCSRSPCKSSNSTNVNIVGTDWPAIGVSPIQAGPSAVKIGWHTMPLSGLFLRRQASNEAVSRSLTGSWFPMKEAAQRGGLRKSDGEDRQCLRRQAAIAFWTPEHLAVYALISWSFPPSPQVTDIKTSVLRSQEMLQSFALWQSAAPLKCRTLMTADGPAGPAGPGGPANPCGPWAPRGPIGPAGPCFPSSPRGPCFPCGPGAP